MKKSCRILKDTEAMSERHTENAVGYSNDDKNRLIKDDESLMAELKNNIAISTAMLEEIKRYR